MADSNRCQGQCHVGGSQECMHYGAEKEQLPFYVKSNWNSPVQQSVALESYSEEVKISLAEINLTKPKNNLPPAEREALKALKGDKQINLGNADKGTNTVVMTKEEKLNEGQIQLNERERHRPLESPMVDIARNLGRDGGCACALRS